MFMASCISIAIIKKNIKRFTHAYMFLKTAWKFLNREQMTIFSISKRANVTGRVCPWDK